MRFSSFVKTSTLEWEGMICSVVTVSDGGEITEDEVLSYFEERKGMIDALLIEGDESTKGMIPFIKAVRSAGLKTGIITDGKHPDSLEDLIGANYLEHVIMKIDSPAIDADMRTSISIILEYGIGHEFRTVLDEKRITPEGVSSISRSIKGAKNYVLMMPKENGFKKADALRCVEDAKSCVKNVRIRQ